jgi:hypothetical protein
LSIPGRARPGRDHYAGLKTGASRHHSIATTTRYPVITGSLHMQTIAGQAPRGCCGGLTSPQLPPGSSLCVTYWLVTRNEPVPNTGAQRDTPELPVEVCREAFLRLSEQIGAQSTHRFLASERCFRKIAASRPRR